MLKVVALLIDLEVDLHSINYQTMNNILHIAVSNNDEQMLTLLTSRIGYYEILSSLANRVNEKGLCCVFRYILFFYMNFRSLLYPFS